MAQSKFGNAEAVARLLEDARVLKDIDEDDVDEMGGQCALQFACFDDSGPYPEVVELLLAAGAYPSVRRFSIRSIQ